MAELAPISHRPSDGARPRGRETLSRRGAFVVLALITLLAGALRTVGLAHRLPEIANADEGVYALQLSALRADDARAQALPWYRYYPDAIPRVVALTTALVVIPRRADLSEHVRIASVETTRLRAAVALLSLLAIPGTYRLARRFLTRRGALLAAALCASSLLLQWKAQQARPHAALAGVVPWVMVAACAAARRPSVSRWATTGLVLGFALAILQSALALFACPIAAALVARRGRGVRVLGALLACVVALASASLAYRFVWTERVPVEMAAPGTANASIEQLFSHRVGLDAFDGTGWREIVRWAWVFDPLLFGLAAAAVIWAIATARRGRAPRAQLADLGVVLAHAVPYALAIAIYRDGQARFILPLLPVACIAAAALLTVLPRRACGASVAIVLCAQLVPAVLLARWRAGPHTLAEAAAWVDEHFSRDARIELLPVVELPLVPSDEAWASMEYAAAGPRTPWFSYTRSLEAGERARLARDIHLVALSTEAARRTVRDDAAAFVRASTADGFVVTPARDEPPVVSALRGALHESFVLAARFDPLARRPAFGVDDTHPEFPGPRRLPYLWMLLHVRALGPVVEVHVRSR